MALLGPPNSGKSSLHDALTGSGATVGAYPFTTQFPQPGMVPVGDVGIQLVDLPPVAEEHPMPWIGNALQPADGALLVVDLSQAECVTAVDELVRLLAERRVFLIRDWPRGAEEASDPDDPFAKLLPTAVVAAKADLADAVEEEAEVLLELLDLETPGSSGLGDGGGDRPPGCLALRRARSGAGVYGVRRQEVGRPPLYHPARPDASRCGRSDPQGFCPGSQVRPSDPTGSTRSAHRTSLPAA